MRFRTGKTGAAKPHRKKEDYPTEVVSEAPEALLSTYPLLKLWMTCINCLRISCASALASSGVTEASVAWLPPPAADFDRLALN